MLDKGGIQGGSIEQIMTIRLEDFLATRPRSEIEAVKKRAAELIEEEATLRKLRALRKQSQEQVAKKLGIQQAAVSKLERRTDMYNSTLRDVIRAMGGELDIVARFPDRRPVRITQFRALEGKTV
jgi:DNA-binding XRE family transcriptional regulator